MVLIPPPVVRKHLRDSLLLLLGATAVALALLADRADFALALVILPGVWMIDGLLKYLLKFSNETLFADLSFAALIYSASRASGGLDRDTSLIFVSLLLWLGNLSACRGLNDRQVINAGPRAQNRQARNWIMGFSVLLALLSVGVALVPLLLGTKR